MRTDKDIGFFRKLVLKFLTKLQEKTITRTNAYAYMQITKLHFKIYYGLDLIEEAIKDSREFRKCQHRHGCIVITNVFSHASAGHKTLVYNMIKTAFRSNCLLETKLERSDS